MFKKLENLFKRMGSWGNTRTRIGRKWWTVMAWVAWKLHKRWCPVCMARDPEGHSWHTIPNNEEYQAWRKKQGLGTRRPDVWQGRRIEQEEFEKLFDACFGAADAGTQKTVEQIAQEFEEAGVEMKVAEHFSLQENLDAASDASPRPMLQLPEFKPLVFKHTFKQPITIHQGEMLQIDYVITSSGKASRLLVNLG